MNLCHLLKPCDAAATWVLLALAAGLVSCGGGSGGVRDPASVGGASFSTTAGGMDASDEARLMAEGAALNAEALDGAERAAQKLRAAEPTEVVGPGGEPGLAKASASELTVYRFYNATSGAHFYTASVTERDQIRGQVSAFAYEGPAFQASAQGGASLSPVYRFFNSTTGVHFYTISEAEKTHIQQTLPQFRLEGVAYYASQVATEGYRPLYRSYVLNKGFHFYSVSAAEGSGLAQYRAEGVAYHVVGTAGTATPPPSDPGPGVDATCGLANFQADLMQQINAVRASAGICGGVARPATTPLTWNTSLQAAATRHSTDMAQNNFSSHTGSDGSSAGTRVTAAGYAWRGYGENIAAGQADITAVMNAWLGSAGHCDNIMNSGFNDVALACVSQSGTRYGKYWTMVLGRR